MFVDPRPYYPQYEDLHRHIFKIYHRSESNYELVYKLCDNNPPVVYNQFWLRWTFGHAVYVSARVDLVSKTIWHDSVI